MKKKCIFFEIAHPKHFHQFRYLIDQYSKDYDVKIVVIQKEISVQLIEELGYEYIKIGSSKTGMHNKILNSLLLLFNFFKLIRKHKPVLIASKASPYSTLVSRLFRSTKTVIMTDMEGIGLTNKVVIPNCDYIVTPNNFREDHGAKHKRINGMFETCYLHPEYFTPEWEFINEHLSKGKPYFLLRFVTWNAYHDVNHQGINDKQKVQLVEKLEQFGTVYISAEGDVPLSIEKNLIKIPVSKIHSALIGAHLYVGDSGTMAVEAVLLGTPSVRTNSYVGDTDHSNFHEVERKNEMLYSYPEFDKAFQKAIELAADPNAKDRWKIKRDQYFNGIGANPNLTLKSIVDEMII